MLLCRAQASPEYLSAKDPPPVPQLAAGGGITLHGVPYDAGLFATGAPAVPDSSIEGFCSTLPSISAAGLAAPAADRLVRPELAEVYTQFAAGILELSRKLQGISGAAAAAGGGGCPQLRLQHFCQVTFGRLDLAWQAALEQQQQQE